MASELLLLFFFRFIQSFELFANVVKYSYSLFSLFSRASNTFCTKNGSCSQQQRTYIIEMEPETVVHILCEKIKNKFFVIVARIFNASSCYFLKQRVITNPTYISCSLLTCSLSITAIQQLQLLLSLQFKNRYLAHHTDLPQLSR